MPAAFIHPRPFPLSRKACQQMIDQRASGILMHPTSLPGGHGIGDLGPAARRFLEQLEMAGQQVWQILPLAPTSMGNSPYSALSSFAGNPLLISFDDLVADGFAPASLLDGLPGNEAPRVDYDRVAGAKLAALDQVADAFLKRAPEDAEWGDFELFLARNEAEWLDDFALYTVLKARHGGSAWMGWEPLLATRDAVELDAAREALGHDIAKVKVIQFLFFRQWLRLKAEANRRSIRIMGDIPIFVAGDSADVWANRHLFEMADDGSPTLVAGVPPDYFSATGQRWGNPLYRWDAHRAEGFAWWHRRILKTLETVDMVRIDHFRGFESYWEIPASEETAINGRWVPAPGYELFQSLRDRFGELPIIAEDLGIITPEVERLRDHFGFPGMRVLPFEWGENFDPGQYDPNRYSANSVFYTGTHDNDTIMGWFNSLGGRDSDRGRTILHYLGSDGWAPQWDFIRFALGVNSRLTITPLQDVIGLGTEARMNIPGLPDGNWGWRLQAELLTDGHLTYLRQLTAAAGRV